MSPGHYQFELTVFCNPQHSPEVVVPTYARVNSDLHLIHTVRGRGLIRIGRRELALSDQHVICIPPFTRYWCGKRAGSPLEMINFHFRLAFDDGHWMPARLGLPPVFTPPRLSRIHQVLRRRVELWKKGNPIERSEVAADLLRLVNGYLRQFGTAACAAARDDTEMLRLRQELNNNLQGQYDAETCAASLGLSVSQMNRRFRRLFGESPKTCWQRARLSRIQAFLRSTDLSVIEIADRCGFADPLYLSRWFKQWAGVGPSRFRRDIQWADV